MTLIYGRSKRAGPEKRDALITGECDRRCPSADITCARLVSGLITRDYVTTVSARAPSFITLLVVSRIPGALRNDIRPMGVETFKTADLDLSRGDR